MSMQKISPQHTGCEEDSLLLRLRALVPQVAPCAIAALFSLSEPKGKEGIVQAVGIFILSDEVLL